MTVTPVWLQAGTYDARKDRLVVAADHDSEGIIRGFLVSARGAGANMSVDVSSGLCVVQGDDSPNQGMYVVENDASMNLTITTAPSSGSRIDLVVVKVNDPGAGGAAGSNAVVSVVAGSPSATPVPPAVPATALVIGRVNVGTNVASIVAGAVDITTDAQVSQMARWA